MSKSLDFVLDRIASGQCNGMEKNHYESSQEINTVEALLYRNIIREQKLIDLLQSGETVAYVFEGTLDHITPVKINANLTYNPNAAFDYFTMERCSNDGTLMFIDELIYKVFAKVITLQTTLKSEMTDNVVNNLDKATFNYTIGNFIVMSEHGKEFATEEKPWMLSRFTVALPIKMNIEVEEL